MRFNKKEMLTLALQPSHKFDKEGILFIKEKQEGFFKRSERNENPKRRRSKSLQELYCYGGTSKANFERWCRLRGNLLFYMKSRDQWSEPAGVIIIQNCTIKLDHSVFEGMYGFYLVFDHGASQHIATRTQYERDLWLEVIQVSSYDTVRSKLLSLQEKLEKKQSYDPDLDVNMWRIRQGHHSIDIVEVPICEVSLSCDNLLCDGNGRSPRPVLIIQVYIPTEDIWLKYANTEVVEKSSNPVFLKTVCFWPSDGLSNDTLIQIKAYDVREKVSGLATPLGSTKLYLSTLLECTHPRFRVQILSSNNTVIGFLTLTIWRHERDVAEKTSTESTPSRSLNSRNSSMAPCHRRTQSLPPRFTVKQKMPHQGHLQLLYANAILSTYRFHSGLGGDISVHEIMAESKLCFYFPQQLLEVWMQEEKELLQEVAGMGELAEPWNSRQLEVLDTHLQLLHLYSQAKENLRVQRGSFFKASSRKGDRSLEFAPINLHLQRMWAQNDTLKKTGFYDVITVGAFTAHSHRSNNGGLIRLVQQVKESAAEDKNCVTQSGVNKITMAYDAVQAIKLLRREVVDGMGTLLRLAKQKETHGMLPVCEDMISKTRILLSLWDSGLVEEALAFIEENKLTKISTAAAETEKISNMSPFKKIAQQLSLISKNNTEEPATIDSPSYDPNLWRLLPQVSSNKIPSCVKGDTPDDGQFVIFPEAEDDVISSRVACNTSILDSNDPSSENKRFLDTQAMCNSPSANYYKPTEEPEPWDLTQLNIEASVMCLVSKVKFLCGRCNSPAVRLRTQNSTIRSQSFRREVAKRQSAENTEKADGETPDKSVEPEGTCLNKIRNKFTEGLELNSMLDWAAELKPSMRKLRQAMDGLLKTARLTHSVFRIQQDRRITQRCCNLRYRRHVCFSQALTSVVTALMTKFWCLKMDPAFLYILKTIGPLASFEGLLTYYGDEVDMWGDMVIAIEDLTTVTFALVPSSKSRKESWPRVIGSRSALTVLLPIPESLFSSLSLSPSQTNFRITPVFFNIGINEMATLAESLGTTKPQQQSNIDNFDRLNEYYYRLKKLNSNSCLDINAKRYLVNTQRSSSLPELLERLKTAIHSNKSKNVDVLQLSAEFCRNVQGLRFVTCKSAKDRTSMAVTLDQCLILQAEYDLAEHDFQKALDCMRSEGTRRQNTFKNVGVRKYAFNSIQILPLPKLYRPPSGTYGSTQT